MRNRGLACKLQGKVGNLGSPNGACQQFCLIAINSANSLAELNR